jgi:hypothetical protein
MSGGLEPDTSVSWLHSRKRHDAARQGEDASASWLGTGVENLNSRRMEGQDTRPIGRKFTGSNPPAQFTEKDQERTVAHKPSKFERGSDPPMDFKQELGKTLSKLPFYVFLYSI